jgi:glycosyltransferase involved in cell wall biosynthesis
VGQAVKIIIATLMREQGTTGVQAHFNSLRAAMEENGSQVTLVNSFSANAWLYGPVYAVRPLLLARWFKAAGVFWYRYWHCLFLRWSLTRRLRCHSVDLINAQCPLSARAALLARRRTGRDCRVVLTCHFNITQAEEFAVKGELERDSTYFRRIVSLEKEMLTKVDGVVFVSAFSRQNICDRHSLSGLGSRVIHNGVADQGSGGGLDRSKLNLPRDAFVVMSVGTLEPRKNQYAWVRAMLGVLRARPQMHLVLIGDGQDKRRIESLVADNGMQRQVRLLGFRSDARQLLRLADVYCHPARMENFPVTLVEAAAAGLPIIAARVGGIPEFIEHQRTGLLVDLEDGELEFARWIQSLAENLSLRDRLAEGARKAYRARLTESAMAEAYLGYFHELAECRNAR